MPRLVGAPLLLIILLLPIDNSFAQTAVNLFGSSTPAVADSGDSKAVVVGVKIFSDVAGQVRGCSFYKALTNTGVHTVSLWDSVGTLLATEAATGETASGRQSVMFVTPVSIAAKQVFTCGYFAPNGHYSDDTNAFAVQKDVSPLHVPAEGGVYRYGTTPTAWPTYVAQASNYGVDVVFAPLSGVATWISAANVNTTTSGATITWNTAVPSDSQVEYGATTSYGNTTPLASARVTSHSVALTALIAGSPYHFRVRSRDSDAVTAIGLDYTFALPMPVSISVSPLVASISSGTTQQFMATVSNTANASVIWSATAGTVSSSGLFTAPIVSAATPVTVTATSQADASKRALVTLTVNPSAPVLNVSPLNLSFSAQTGSSNLTPASVSITNTGGGSLTFTGVSDQPWLVLSAGSGTAPSSLQVSPALTGLKAGTYSGHINVTGGGVTKTVAVALTMTSPPIQHSVALSWKASANTNVISYSMYRSTLAGTSYGLTASAIEGLAYSDQSVQPGTTYYYVVTAWTAKVERVAIRMRSAWWFPND